MSADDIEALRVAGFGDRAIHDATQIASYFNYINRVADALHAEARPQYVQAYARAAQAPTELDLAQAGVASVIWATGYRPRFERVHLPIFTVDGYPLHRRGLTAHPGLYFLGLEWQHSAQSHVFQGLGADAAYLAEAIALRAG